MRRIIKICIVALLILGLGAGVAIADAELLESIHEESDDFENGDATDNLDLTDDSINWEPEDGDETANYVSDTHDIAGDTAFVDVEANLNTELEISLEYYDGTDWVEYDSKTTEDDGVKEFSISDQSNDEWRFNIDFSVPSDVVSGDEEVVIQSEGLTYQTSNPELSNLNPNDEFIEDRDVELSVEVTDEDLETENVDEVDVEVYLNGELVDEQTIDEDSTVTYEPDEAVLGQNEWYVVAEDDAGNSVESDVKTFETPAELEIKDVHDNELIEDVEIQVEFFSGETVVDRTTEDGTVDLTGLPADKDIIVRLNAEGYHDRTTIIASILEQQNAWMLEDSGDVDDVSIVFELEDFSGQFGSSETQLKIQRAIELDGEKEWQTVSGELFGAAGEVTGTLERNQRYRLVIENEDGLTRTLGDYTPTEDVVTTLEVGTIEWSAESDTYRWFTEYNPDETGHNVEFVLESDQEDIENLNVELIDQLSGDVIDEESEPGPVSEFSTQFDVPDEYQNRTLVVDWTADRNDQEISGTRAVGDRPGEVDNPFDGPWAMLVVGVVLMGVGLLFGGAFGAIGALIVSMSAAVLWWLGWLTVPVGVVIAALTISALYILGGEK